MVWFRGGAQFCSVQRGAQQQRVGARTETRRTSTEEGFCKSSATSGERKHNVATGGHPAVVILLGNKVIGRQGFRAAKHMC